MKSIFISGICGFIGSNIAEFYAKQDHDVIGVDNFSRSGVVDNHKYLIRNYPNITIYQQDLRDYKNLLMLFKSIPKIDIVIHTAAQTAVTISIKNPKEDFENNVIGSFNLLEAIRESGQKPTLIYCSTNKVYGTNIDYCGIQKEENRYRFNLNYKKGIKEDFPIDHTSHSPYGISKLSADLYFQEWGYQYGFKVGVFRCSCIYGMRQKGSENQGWVFHFIKFAIKNKTINIFGDGKQVRDVLYISDLIQAFDSFINSDLQNEVFNIGGGSENTLSLLELIEILEIKLFKDIKVEYHNWRSSDQKVYISDISKAQKELGFIPEVSPIQGIEMVLEYLKNNRSN